MVVDVLTSEGVELIFNHYIEIVLAGIDSGGHNRSFDCNHMAAERELACGVGEGYDLTVYEGAVHYARRIGVFAVVELIFERLPGMHGVVGYFDRVLLIKSDDGESFYWPEERVRYHRKHDISGGQAHERETYPVFHIILVHGGATQGRRLRLPTV